MALKPKDFGGPSFSLPPPLRKVLALTDAAALPLDSLDVTRHGQERNAPGQVAREDVDRFDAASSTVMNAKQEAMQLNVLDVTTQSEAQAWLNR